MIFGIAGKQQAAEASPTEVVLYVCRDKTENSLSCVGGLVSLSCLKSVFCL